MALPLSYTRNYGASEIQCRELDQREANSSQKIIIRSRHYFCLSKYPGKVVWKWGVKDLNLRRHCHQIYSLTPLTARETPLLNLLDSLSFSELQFNPQKTYVLRLQQQATDFPVNRFTARTLYNSAPINFTPKTTAFFRHFSQGFPIRASGGT